MEIMNTRLHRKTNYTVDELTGLSKRCDWFIHGKEVIKKKDNPQTIYLSGLQGNQGIKHFTNELLPKIENNIVLIIAGTDLTFPSGKGDLRRNLYTDCQELINIILNSNKILHIFVENLDTIHPKLSPIPLGLLPGKTFLDLSKFINVDFNNKKNLCLVRHRTREGINQWKDRKIADELCKNEWANFVNFKNDEIPIGEFIEELKNSKFCLCIHGGGYDPCPKFFQCILYGTIPIIQHSTLDAVFEKFPVLFIDELNKNALSENLLNEKYKELKVFYEGGKREEILKLLTLDYWWNIILSYLVEK